MTSPVHAIGIDVGGSKTAIGVVDVGLGRVIGKAVLPTPAEKPQCPAFLNEVAATAKAMGPLPIGIGLCELVSLDGEIASSHRVAWTAEQLRDAFQFAPKLAFDADVRLAAAAEARFGAGRNHAHWIYANIGTGVATVLMVNGQPYSGAHGLGMAFGMSPVSLTENGPSLTIEDMSGAAGMVKRAAASGGHFASMQDLLAPAPQDAATARKVIAEGAAVAGRALAWLANMLDPQLVVLGGGVAVASPLFLETCKRSFAQTCWFDCDRQAKMVLAELSADAGLIGAALHGYDRQAVPV